jgi:hypothetical protein
MPQPPQHSITAPIKFIPVEAFDEPRAVEEMADMEDGLQHPLMRYLSGATRYDLGAAYPVGDEMRSASDYLRSDHGHPVWELRRLKLAEVSRCRDLGGASGQYAAFRLAFVSVSGVEGAPVLAAGKTLSEAQADSMIDTVGATAIYLVGEAALRASEAPRDAEKKR